MRLFIGYRAKIYQYSLLQEKLKPYFWGNWTKEINLHLTLLFLGNMDKNFVINRLKDISFPKEKVLLKGLSTFGNPPKILFVKATNNIYSSCNKEIAELLNIKPQKFHPHITIMRVKKSKKDYKNIIEDINKDSKTLGYIEPTPILFKSTLTPQGPIYTPIFNF